MQPCRAVVVGDSEDPHVADVLKFLPLAGTVVLDASTISSVLIERDDVGWVLRDASGHAVAMSRDTETRGWIRRYSPPDWDAGVAIGSHHAAVLTARLALLGTLMRDASVQWLSPSDRLSRAENKLLQYEAARHIGIRVPRTVISADLATVVAKVGEPFVVKPLGASHFSSSGTTRVVYAESVRAAELAGIDLLEAPFLMQERLLARSHLRVVTVRQRAWVCELQARDLPIDWRRVDAAHNEFEVAHNHDTIASMAVELALKMGVGYSSQDWILDEDGPSFIDLNPAGQWAFLPPSVSNDVTASIGAWLIKAGS